MAKHASKRLKMKKNVTQQFSFGKVKNSNYPAKSSTGKDSIVDYLNLCTKFESHIPRYRSSWKVTLEENLVFYKVDISNLPTIIVSIKIDKNLKVEVFTEYGKVKRRYLQPLLNSQLVLEYWSELKNLLKYFGDENKSGHISIKQNLIQSLKYLEKCQGVDSKKGDIIGLRAKLDFIQSQVDALVYNRYSPNMLFLAYSIYLKSSSCYKYIQSLEFLILPKEEDLVKYISNANVSTEEKI